MLYKASGVGLCVMVLLYLIVGKTFMPTLDERRCTGPVTKVTFHFSESSLSLDTRVQQSVLEAVPEVKSIIARAEFR